MSGETLEFKPSKTDRPIGGGDGIGPGHINIGGGFFDGHYPSNLCVQFPRDGSVASLDQQINEYFAQNQGMVVTGVFYSGNAALVFYTRVLSREEVDQFNRLYAEVKAKMSDEDTKKAQAQAEVAKRQADAEKENKRLMEVGRKCEANHKKDKANAEG